MTIDRCANIAEIDLPRAALRNLSIVALDLGRICWNVDPSHVNRDLPIERPSIPENHTRPHGRIERSPISHGQPRRLIKRERAG